MSIFPAKAACEPSWDARALSDSCRIASRLQTVVRFQVASSLQTVLDRVLPGAQQLVLVLLSCFWLETAVRRGGASAFKLLRDIAFIQLGQSIMALSGGFERTDARGEMSLVNLFLLRTCLLCAPPFAFGVVAGLGFRATMADYIQNAVTAYQYRYSAAASAVLQGLKVGVTPVLLGAAFVRMSSLLAPAAPAAPAGAPAGPTPAAPGLLSLVQGALHLVLVDMLLFDLKHQGAAGGVHVQLALSALALVGLDSLAAVLQHEAEGVHKALEAIRGFALWRVAQQLLQMDLVELDVFLASAGAVLLVACRTAVALGRDARAGEAVARTGNGPSLLNTLSEVALLASTQMLVSPAASSSNQTLEQHLLCILYVAAAAGCLERTLSGK
jgi:hypothetical protein